ncbi:DNA-binding NarL/FixJ family response regulator [Streptomyces sp. LBL]|uniref:response regulator transcription factor n=1 Tax=Streptomyces sp. LBL TaxID=2940562 RepID=UPI0024732F8A|nr:response regulator transcription factor [Streptomyces sp. LBL]MDH6624628.1 DNA-binding NarL/FixJ family response regulator [Streptomyces sp. LBL]
MITVLIVHQQALQRLGLRMLLAARPGLTVVGETADEAEAIPLTDRLRPDVVLMDGRGLGTGGIETVRRLTRSSRVLLLNPTGHDPYVAAALRAGAGGFIEPDATPDQLTAAIHTVAVGDAVISSGLTRELIDIVRRQRPVSVPAPAPRLDALTGRERDVLTAVASGCSNAEVAERLSIAPTTVKSHVSHILTKIGARTRVQAVIFAYETGLLHPTMTPHVSSTPHASSSYQRVMPDAA